MSALDQQVAEARGVLSKAAYRRSNENVPVDHRTREADYERALDALLTTHRRQVLTEIEEKLRAHAKSMPSNITVHRRQRAGVVESADFVASLRDTKENV